jgi:hypothetical protein
MFPNVWVLAFGNFWVLRLVTKAGCCEVGSPYISSHTWLLRKCFPILQVWNPDKRCAILLGGLPPPRPPRISWRGRLPPSPQTPPPRELSGASLLKLPWGNRKNYWSRPACQICIIHEANNKLLYYFILTSPNPVPFGRQILKEIYRKPISQHPALDASLQYLNIQRYRVVFGLHHGLDKCKEQVGRNRFPQSVRFCVISSSYIFGVDMATGISRDIGNIWWCIGIDS